MYITVADILAKATEAEIFEKYSGIQVKIGEKFCSPLRLDRKPTCSFMRDGAGRLILKDFSGHFYGDCFQFVMKKYNLSFYDGIRLVAQDFGIIREEEVFTPQPKEYIEKNVKSKKDNSYVFKMGKWDKNNIEYWKDNFRVEAETLDFFRTRPINTLWRGDEIVYRWSQADPGFVYYFDKDDFKIYFPLRDKFKFISQAKSIQGWRQLPAKGEVLIITKSMKDVIVLGVLGLPAIAPQSESTYIEEKVMKKLFKRFRKIVVLYDFDLTGVSYSNKIRRKYGKNKIKQFFFTDGRFGSPDYGEKDASDLLEVREGNVKAFIIEKITRQSQLYRCSKISQVIDRRSSAYKALDKDFRKVLEDLFIPGSDW